jgi:hypothetical protein
MISLGLDRLWRCICAVGPEMVRTALEMAGLAVCRRGLREKTGVLASARSAMFRAHRYSEQSMPQSESRFLMYCLLGILVVVAVTDGKINSG